MTKQPMVAIPQGLEPLSILARFGTTEFVP
jgi:hypothetical protein